MGVKHILWVVGAELINCTELDQLLIDAGVPKFFLSLDNVVHIHSFLYLPLIKLLDLVLREEVGWAASPV